MTWADLFLDALFGFIAGFVGSAAIRAFARRRSPRSSEQPSRAPEWATRPCPGCGEEFLITCKCPSCGAYIPGLK